MPSDGNSGRAQSAGADAACCFCSPQLHARAVAVRGTVLAVEDSDPVTGGHLLIITRRHVRDFFDMTEQEQRDAMELLAILRDHALHADPTITGFNVGANCGASAGQRVLHAHLHFIPRHDIDEKKLRPVKGVIRNKMSY